MHLTKSQIQALRDLPVDHVRQAFLDAGQALRQATRPVRNGLDVAIYEAGLPYQQAQEKLAMLFPEALEIGDRVRISTFEDAFEGAMRAAKARREPFPAFSPQGMRTARDLVTWWKALQLESLDINPGIPRAVKDRCKDRIFTDFQGHKHKGIYVNTKLKGLDLYDTIRLIPYMMALSAQGRTETEPVGIFCTPHWRFDRVGIVMDDIFNPDFMSNNPDLLEKYPPSAIINTSDRFPQVFWILEKKFPEPEFYDDFVIHLNTTFHGDKKIRRMGWNTRVGGFLNQKRFCQDGSGRTPFVHVRESTSRYPIEMHNYMCQFHEQWLKQRDTVGLMNDFASAPDPIKSKPARKLAGPLDFARLPAEPEQPQVPGVAEPWDIAEGSISLDKMVSRLKKVILPDWVEQLGLQFQEYFKTHPDPKRTRSETDFEVALMMHECGIYPDEIYSFMDKHLLQNSDPVPRKHQDGTEFTAVRIDGPKAYDRACRRVTCNSSPLPKDSHRSKNSEKYNQKDLWQIYRECMPTRDHAQVMQRLEEWDAREARRFERQQAEAESLADEGPVMSM